MPRILLATLALVLAGFANYASTDDKKDAKKDDKAALAGTWKWSVTVNDQTRETTLKLKQDGDKVTGVVITGQNNTETAIEEATFKDGELSFKVTRERNGMKRTTKYTGKLSGDSIKGKAESERNGETQSRDWEAKRVKE